MIAFRFTPITRFVKYLLLTNTMPSTTFYITKNVDLFVDVTEDFCKIDINIMERKCDNGCMCLSVNKGYDIPTLKPFCHSEHPTFHQRHLSFNGVSRQYLEGSWSYAMDKLLFFCIFQRAITL